MEKKKVTLEPDLELQASFLNASQCREMARQYERWAHQLRVKAKILLEQSRTPPAKVKRLSARQLRHN